MTDFLAYILITASVLVSLFLVGVVVVARRSRYHDAYVPSPESRVTPLGVYTPRDVHKKVSRADIRAGMDMARMREYAARYPTWQPIEDMQTVKVRAKHDR